MKQKIFSIKLKRQKTFIKYKENEGFLNLSFGYDQNFNQSIIKDLKIKFNCPLFFPKELAYLSKEKDDRFVLIWSEELAEHMNKTIYHLFRFLFINSFFDKCLTKDEYEKLILRTLSYGERSYPLNEQEAHGFIPDSPSLNILIENRDFFKALTYEINSKYIFYVADVLNKPFGSIKNWDEKNPENIQKLKKCLDNWRHQEESDPSWKCIRINRAKSLKAFGFVLSYLADLTNDLCYGFQPNYAGNIK